MTKKGLVACHRLANSDRTIIKVLKRKHMKSNKSKLLGMNFSDISNIIKASNTSNSIEEEASMNSPHNTCIRNLRFFINYSLCSYYQFLYGKVKKMIQEGLFRNFWISQGGIIVEFWNIDFYHKFEFRILLIFFPLIFMSYL